jgi:hypothetical protein
MTGYLRLVVPIAFMALLAGGAWGQTRPKVTELGTADPQSILYVGNSFFYYNNGIDELVGGLYRAAHPGHQIAGALVTIGGASWKWHDVDSYFRPDAIDSFGFDAQGNIVILKQTGKLFDVAVMMDCSQCAINPIVSRDFFEYARKNAAIVRRHGAVPVFFMTWAYADHPEMTEQVAEAYTKVGNDNDVLVIPVGLAFARARRDRPDIDLYMGDRRHPTLAGSYLAACTVFAVLFDRSPAGLRYTGGVPQSAARRLQEFAWATVQQYYGR